jgi:hypothetical protein
MRAAAAQPRYRNEAEAVVSLDVDETPTSERPAGISREADVASANRGMKLPVGG